MYAGSGRAGDFAGDPLKTVGVEYIYWLGAGKVSLRAVWTDAAGLPAHKWIIYRNGSVQAHDVASPQTFGALAIGVIPNLAAVAVAAAAYDSGYDPLGGMNVANLLTLKRITFDRMRGLFRIENPAIDLYEVFKGEGALPDVDGAPWQTFSALPFTTPALTNGVTTYLTLRKRNKYNLQSKNVETANFILDAGGVLSVYPSNPQEVRAEQAAAGAVRIRAWYDWAADASASRADTWAVWITTDGSTPNPAVAATYTVAMNLNDADAKLDYTTGGNVHGTTVKVLVRARRAAGGDSLNTDVQTVIADAQGPVAPTRAQAFLGQTARTV